MPLNSQKLLQKFSIRGQILHNFLLGLNQIENFSFQTTYNLCRNRQKTTNLSSYGQSAVAA